MTFVDITANSETFCCIDQDYNNIIKPILEVYAHKNSTLRAHVSRVLRTSSELFDSQFNIEIFTTMCLSLGITVDKFSDINILNFKKSIISHLSRRESFNMLECVHDCFDTNRSTLCEKVWCADTVTRRGHDRVGEGEIFFSFFTGGIKPKGGDISIERVAQAKIEFKGTSGRLLSTDKIVITEAYKDVFRSNNNKIQNTIIAIAVLSGIINSAQAIDIIKNNLSIESCLTIYNDIYNAVIATDALKDYDHLACRIDKRWSRNTRQNTIKLICGAVQLAFYRKQTGFNYIILTNTKTPYVCKGFEVSESVLANTLTFISNDILIDQNLDGKGYHISLKE